MVCSFKNISLIAGRIGAISAVFLFLVVSFAAAETGEKQVEESKSAAESIIRIPDEDVDKSPGLEFVVRPIGFVMKEGDKTEIFLEKKYEPGLMGLEPGMYIMVFWWFDKNDTPENRRVVQVHPRGDIANPLRGVFATRSPRRPNLIALTCCKVTAVRGNVLEIDKIDAFGGTPVLDIKPYVSVFDSPRK